MCLAIPGRVVQFADEASRLATVEVAGVRRTVNVSLLDEEHECGVAIGDWVLIHVGFAISRVDDDEARATLRLLEAMGASYEEELEELKASSIE
jgi:hydrogenase expression/formation protein HypC